MKNPKVFISHASEDKPRFVTEFAKKLRAKGVDAWLDKWEMLPGDSLVDKIFEEGIKSAEVFLIVLSKHSVDKLWVKEELNASFVKRVSKNCKIIPVVIDDCLVPECLKSTVWEKISNIDGYEQEFERILNSIFGTSQKPVIGSPPKYTTLPIDVLPNLTKTDSIVFKLACDFCIQSCFFNVEVGHIYAEVKTYDIADEAMYESIEILDSRGYINATRTIGGPIPLFDVTTWGFDQYVKSYISDYDNYFNDVCLKILNENMHSNIILAQSENISVTIVNHILNVLESRRLVKLTKGIGGPVLIVDISPELKRMLI